MRCARSTGATASTVHGFVPSMAPFFAAAHAVVVPILTGAGIRVKIVEAMSAGRALVSTSLGLRRASRTSSRTATCSSPTSPAAFADGGAAPAAATRPCGRAWPPTRASWRCASTTGAASATGSRPCCGPRRVSHVGLNLVFMVPGQTGGMEVAARALIPALRDAAPGLRFTAFVNREAAGRGPRRRVAASCPSRRRAASSGCAASSSCCPAWPGGPGSTSSTRSARPRRPAARFARVTTIHDLNYLMVPDAHFGVRGLGMRVLVPLAARTAHARDRRLGVDPRRPRRAACACRTTRSTSSRSASAGPAEAAPTPEAELRATLALGRPAGRAQPLGQAAAQEPARAARRARAASRPSGGPCSCSPATRRRTRPSCATTPRALGRHRRRALPRLDVGRGRRGPVRALPPRSSSRRSTRASACRCSRRWRAACPSRARTARRSRRSPATPRCCSIPTTRRRSPPRSSACSAIPPRRRGSRGRARRRPRGSPGRARPS